ncbi:type II secretion system protein [Patescibacteria group bacterium]
MNKTKGFTLIELLVVIAIIGILSSVVLASLNTAREKSRDAKRISDIKQIQLALELYYDTNSAYPTETQGIAILATDGFLPSTPTPPAGSGQAAYAYSGLNSGCTSYHLGAVLENTTHTVLPGSAADADAAAAVLCGAAGDTDFGGATVDCAVGAAGAGCYDVTP